MYVVTASQMQEMDRRTIEEFGIPGIVLMENAGRGATQVFLDQFRDGAGKRIGVMAGRGNNGGDGFVMARYLAQMGLAVVVYLLTDRNRVKGDALANLNLLEPLKVPVVELPDEAAFLANRTSLIHQDIWIDAILGTGLKSEVKGYFRQVIEFVNSQNKPVFAVDIPSGLNSDTGQPCGVCIQADVTATFAYPKIGHVVYPGAAFTGKRFVIDIGIPPFIAESVNPMQQLLTDDMLRSNFRKRPADAHKGNTGHLMVIAGSEGKTGAAAMTAMSALRTGAGLVTLGIPASLNPILETLLLEVMTVPFPEGETGAFGEAAFELIMNQLSGKRCLAIGPGIGTSPQTAEVILKVIENSPIPMVIDADGLNLLAGQVERLKALRVPVILTPHPGEMARLMKTTPAQIQSDRIMAARTFATEYNVHVALKGAATVIAHPDSRVLVNPTGNPGMASGGMGDVLTGIIAGLITQGYAPEFAVRAGVYLHGMAADAVSERTGGFGYIASEVMNAIPSQLARLMSGTLESVSAQRNTFVKVL